MDKISVIVPVYNVAPYIRECLQSIQQQSYKNLEILLVDDGSTDASGAICNQFSRNDSRFKVIHKPNGGVSSARNTGLDAAAGQYIAFVDPDDYLALDFYTVLYRELTDHHADLSVAGTKMIAEYGNSYFHQSPFVEKLNRLAGEGYDLDWRDNIFLGEATFFADNNAVLEGILCNRINCLSWNKLIKRELWGEARYPLDLSLGEDMATVVNVCAGANRAVYCPDAVYYYRMREKSLLHGTVTLERFSEDLRGSEIMQQRLLERVPDRTGDIARLKSLYDLGCYINLVRSEKHTGEASNKKGSRLYRLYSNIERYNRLVGGSCDLVD